MSEHLTVEKIKLYLSRRMKSAELLMADDHLAACDLCYKQINDSSHAQKAVDFDFLQSSAEDFEHLSYEQLEHYVDEKSNDIEKEIADVHLQVCADCKAEMNGLLEMRKLIKVDTQNQALAPPAAEKTVSNKIWSFLSGRYFPKFSLAAIALLLAVSLFGAFWFLRRGNSTEVAVTSPSNADLPQNLQDSTQTPTINIQPNANDVLPKNTNSETNIGTNLQNQTAPPNEIESFPPQYQTEIQRDLADGRLSIPPETNQLNNQTGKLMSGGTQEIPFALSSPVGKIIQSNRPQFRWNKLVGAEGYIVNIYDEDFNKVAGSPQISAATWQVEKPLARNKIYLWQVTAIKEGQEIKSPVRPAPDAKFKVLDAVKSNEIEMAKKQYGNSHLLLGILYANAGLLGEAEAEFQKLLRKNPKSELARKLLRQVQSKR